MPSDPAAPHFRVERLAPGVHAAVARTTGAALANSGIVDLGGATLVFDSTLTPRTGRLLARTAERLTGRAPAFVVNSHYHGDHIWGNGAFVGAHVVSTRTVRSNVIARSRGQFRSMRREVRHELPRLGHPRWPIERADVPQLRAWFRAVRDAPAELPIVPPDVTFNDELVLEGSRRAVHLLSYGGGHSPSDVFAYLPDERIAFVGDLALEGYHLSVGDGYPAEWVRILDRLRRLRPRTVLPGHGPVGTNRTIDRAARYLGDLLTLARRARARSIPSPEFVRTPIPEKYRSLRFTLMFPENLRRVYASLGPAGRRRSSK